MKHIENVIRYNEGYIDFYCLIPLFPQKSVMYSHKWFSTFFSKNTDFFEEFINNKRSNI